MTALKRVLRYLKGTQDLALTYTRGTTPALVAFSDADWAGDMETRKSTSGNVFLMCGAAVTWAILVLRQLRKVLLYWNIVHLKR